MLRFWDLVQDEAHASFDVLGINLLCMRLKQQVHTLHMHCHDIKQVYDLQAFAAAQTISHRH